MILRLWWPQVPHLRVTPPPVSIPQRPHPSDTLFRPPHLRQGGVGDNLEVEGETGRVWGAPRYWMSSLARGGGAPAA